MKHQLSRRRFLSVAQNSAWLMLLSSTSIATRSWAALCEDVFRGIRTANPIAAGPSHRVQAAQALVDLDLGMQSYVVRWRSLDPNARGPFPERGEFLVSGVPKDKIEAWMEKVGENSVGLVISALPERNPGTASLRVGKRYFTFSDIQAARVSDDGSFISKVQQAAWGYSELTLPISKAEQQHILDFILARQEGRILARRDLRGGPQAGQSIRPSFDSEAFTLRKESCAAACTSWFDPKWLSHYDGAEPLLAIAERLDLKPTYIAKQMLWGHVRQPGPIGLTLFGIDRDPGQVRMPGRSEGPRLMADFIRQNEWFKVRGMPAHGYIPDPIRGRTGTIQSERIPLNEYLSGRGEL
jgi:hypothetical protein